MALEEYHARRDFTRTREPAGGGGAAGGGAFVVQKHAARRLHWDFRLEMDGVLKSWAVTREPGTEPGDKRLAVQTEDHPLEYGDFEGVIPQGQYGGGTVMLWDRGTWEPVGDPAQGYAKGKLRFRLHGTRMAGLWHLVRMRGEGGRDWLLIKGHDDEDGEAPEASGGDVSVASGRSMDEIAADPAGVGRIASARATAMPARMAPMLATLAEEAPAGGDWLHEIKFDGYRLLARVEAGGCRLFTRNGHDWTDRFPAIAAACAALPCRQAWLDGEVVALDRHGVSRFHELQAALARGSDAGLVYHVFDLAYVDGHDLTAAALADRKDALRRLVGTPADGPLRFTDHLEGRGPDFRRQVCAFALEGVVSKRRDRPYRPGRGRDWVKAKCTRRQEFVVAGWTPPAGKRSGLGALVLAIYDGRGSLVPAGRVGTGWDEREAERLVGLLMPLAGAVPPFAGRDAAVTWVEPRLVAEVEFAEWTPDGQLRHLSYQGLRQDKDPREVVREHAGPDGRGGDRLAGFRLTSPGKVLYPGQGLTKAALASYYLDVARWMLPHVAGRPLTLVRCPDGRQGECFYQRHPKAGMSKAVHRFPDRDETLMTIEDVEGLVGLVQMGALEIHTWGSTARDIDRPDILVFDLDPDEGLAWGRVVEAAAEMRGRLLAAGLDSFVKTTGGKGLHVAVPLAPRAGWDEAKAFCKAMAEAMAADAPDRYTANMAKARRRGRIFVDYLRNQRAATFVAPYSTRAHAGAPVAVPITWAELEAGIRSDHFTVETLFRRLSALPGDPWQGFAEAARPLPEGP
ncbi:MAG: DNA ligase D [Pseudomonadota bacterium]